MAHSNPRSIASCLLIKSKALLREFSRNQSFECTFSVGDNCSGTAESLISFIGGYCMTYELKVKKLVVLAGEREV